MISFKQLGNMGRLGNQLFQIAATVSLALSNNDKYLLPHWAYEQHFNLHNCFSSNINVVKEYSEPNFHYTKITYEPNLNLNGFFQSKKYFEENANVILGLLTPKTGYGINWNTTAIHVRRGDYINNKAYNRIGMDYYKQAMSMINSKYYMIFSDDISWCKQNFVGDNFIFSEGRDEVTDLSLQLSCEHAIIANSSFSWWAAFLNKNPSKIIVAPQKWFGPSLTNTHDTKDLLLKEWILL